MRYIQENNIIDGNLEDEEPKDLDQRDDQMIDFEYSTRMVCEVL